jgi:hypothetical protein
MSRSSQAKSVKKLEKEVKSMKQAFSQLQQTAQEESEISDESEGESHFQFQFIQDLQLETNPQLKLDLR